MRYSQRKRLIATRAHATATPSITKIGSNPPCADNPRKDVLKRWTSCVSGKKLHDVRNYRDVLESYGLEDDKALQEADLSMCDADAPLR